MAARTNAVAKHRGSASKQSEESGFQRQRRSHQTGKEVTALHGGRKNYITPYPDLRAIRGASLSVPLGVSYEVEEGSLL
jgi:hypothetical protein